MTSTPKPTHPFYVDKQTPLFSIEPILEADGTYQPKPMPLPIVALQVIDLPLLDLTEPIHHEDSNDD